MKTLYITIFVIRYFTMNIGVGLQITSCTFGRPKKTPNNTKIKGVLFLKEIKPLYFTKLIV